MFTKIVMPLTKEEFDPDNIMDSGQVFRMYKKGNTYHAYSGERGISFKYNGNANVWEFYTTKEDWHQFWSSYFDLTTDYNRFNTAIQNSDDSFLKESLEHTPGLRILRQDLWETMVTFVISQHNNIPKIRKTVEILCEDYGNLAYYYVDEKGNLGTYYTFPSATRLTRLSLKSLTEGSMLGYRAKYIQNLAKAVKKDELNLDKLSKMSFANLTESLESVKGIGPKVSHCIALYGFHRMESYPIDVWVKRIINEDYPQYDEKEYLKYISRYRGYQGYIQQLQFIYKRCLAKSSK